MADRKQNGTPTDDAGEPDKGNRAIEEVSRTSEAEIEAQLRAEEDEAPPRRKYDHEDPTHPNWALHKKHVFIVSHSGKPIFSRYGDEFKLVSFMGLIQAMIAFVQNFNDELRAIIAGDHRIVFLLKGPVYLCTVAATHEPLAQLRQQLGYLHSQIYSMLTSNVDRMLTSRTRMDLRQMMGGTDKFLDTLSKFMDRSPGFMLNAMQCLRLPPGVRATIGNILQSVNTPDLVYGLLLAGSSVVNLVQPKKFPLHAEDLQLVINIVTTNVAFRTSESWLPICLPKFNDRGWLHTYVSYLEHDVCLLLFSTKPDTFYELSQAKNIIFQELVATQALNEVMTAYTRGGFRVDEAGVPSLRHFIYRVNGVHQFVAPRLTPPYTVSNCERKRLFRLYEHVHGRVHPPPVAPMAVPSSGAGSAAPAAASAASGAAAIAAASAVVGVSAGTPPPQVYYHVGEKEAVLGWLTAGFELFAVFGPLESKADCANGCAQLLKWLKQEEQSLFILSPPTW